LQYFIGLIAGLIIGSVLVYTVTRLHGKNVETTFSALSSDALRRNSEDFLRLANENLSRQSQAGANELDGKKVLIDQTLEVMKGDLQKVERLITEFDCKREKTFGELSNQLKVTAEQTGRLQETTSKLQGALANTKARGQWGERMAEDVLRFAGFTEGVNYLKQKTQEAAESRPDFTFLLPQELRLNMDVKFPLDNYMKYMGEENDSARDAYKIQFLRDSRQRIKEVTTRDYINPEDRTVDYVLVFVPSEQVYCFINENDRTILDEAMKNKVIFCSPLTLYAILAVIRQAIDNFSLSKTTSQILSLFGEFNKQWMAFKESMDKMGRKIDDTSKEFHNLATTRTNALERSLKRIDEFRAQNVNSEPSLTSLNAGSQTTETGEHPATNHEED
jgi:DNA recombination protein RmuC